ncbi:L-galactose dehydrogenase-like [Diaphorina citri]|uniref:L-galactose dehydrogenase-like n=1 Tax=Diaphorina citri TaxID=121845 RepID=A0A1S4ELK3_DIACI|nr:L-galactose dehydrogenase-like [Diaphorina citri]
MGDHLVMGVSGQALKLIPRESYYISTKIGRYHHQFDFDYKVPRIKASIQESKQRLGLDVIDIIIIHDIEFALVNKQWNVIKNETLPYLMSLKQSREIKHIGISALPLSVLKQMVEELKQKYPGQHVIDFVLTYSKFFLQIHDIEFALVNKQWNVIKNETLPYLMSLKQSQEIKHIGISALPLSVLKQMVEELKQKYPGQHVIDFVLTYSKYTLLDNSLVHYGNYFQTRTRSPS